MSAERRLATIVGARYDGDLDEARQLYESTLRRIRWRSRRGYRTCSSCERDLKPSAFGLDSRARDGLSGRCLDCEAGRKRGERAQRREAQA